MPILPAPALAHLTAVAEGAMSDTCEVLRRVLAGRGPSGGLDVDYQVHATVPCRVAPGWQPPQERSYGGGIASLVAPFVYLPLGTDVQATDRIHVTSGNEAGAVWEVTGTFRRRTQDVQLTVLCSELGDAAA
jgi:hypothetical protein